MPNTCRWVSPVGDTNKAGSTQVCACVCVCMCTCVCTVPVIEHNLYFCLHISVQEQYRNSIGTWFLHQTMD